MQLSDLETLAAAVEEGSLTAAAHRLFISQPAVSVRLQRLEAEVGEPLLRRSGRGVRPTAAGDILYRRAKGLLDEVKRMEAELGGRGPLQGRLSIGATDLVAIYHMPSVLRRFRRKHPNLELNVRVEGTAALVRLLEGGEIELALGTLPVATQRLQTEALYRDQLVILAHPDHRLASGRRWGPADLAGETWIGHKQDSVTRQLLDGFFAAHSVMPRVEMEISNPEAIKKLVQVRLGLAALPWCSVRREVGEGRLAAVKVRGFDLQRISGLILRSGIPPGRAASALRDELEAGAKPARTR